MARGCSGGLLLAHNRSGTTAHIAGTPGGRKACFPFFAPGSWFSCSVAGQCHHPVPAIPRTRRPDAASGRTIRCWCWLPASSCSAPPPPGSITSCSPSLCASRSARPAATTRSWCRRWRRPLPATAARCGCTRSSPTARSRASHCWRPTRPTLRSRAAIWICRPTPSRSPSCARTSWCCGRWAACRPRARRSRRRRRSRNSAISPDIASASSAGPRPTLRCCG